MDYMEVRLERLETMRALYAHALSETPEEDAASKVRGWAEPRGLLDEGSGARHFGRNTYPTNDPEPHGYESYITIGPDVEAEDSLEIREIPGGLYAALRFKGLENIAEAWGRIHGWVEESEYEMVDWRRGEHGWVNGYEEHLNPGEESQSEWVFDLWIQLKE
jgi:effector-binding domain-containing protein